MQGQRRWSVRELRPSDYPGLARLMGEAYGETHRTANEQFLRWQYDQNPLGPVVGCVAVTPEEELVGAYTLIPWPFAVAGRRLPGMLSLNTATSPRYQQQGIFVALANPTYQEAARRGAVGVVGFPNQNSYHGLVNKLDWRHLGRMDAWVRPRKIGTVGASWLAQRSWQRNAASDAAVGGAVRVLDFLNARWFSLRARPGRPASIDDLQPLLAGYAELRTAFRLDYPAEWVRWRYGATPLWRYDYVLDDGEAGVLCKHDTMWGVRTTLLVDFAARFGRPGADRALRRAIAAACARADEEDTSQVMTLLSPGHPASRAIAASGFVKVPERLLPHAPNACYRALGDHPVPGDFPSWALTVGAYDAG